MATIFHADDFGITPDQSRRILACSTACGGTGALNSTSILVGSPRFAECAEVLRPHVRDIHVGVHLNVVEGRCSGDAAQLDRLVDDAGLFRRSFAQMTFAASGNECDALCRQLAHELGAQIDVFLAAFPEMRDTLRIDSHQHFHMIPVVMRALMEALRERGLRPEYLRIPAEPTSPFRSAGGGTIPPVNRLKRIVLNNLWQRSRRVLCDYDDVIDDVDAHSAVFCGIAYSGRMTVENAGAVAPAFERFAHDHGRDVEFLFHPGGYTDAADALNPAMSGFVSFYTDPNRAAEAHALQWFEETGIAR